MDPKFTRTNSAGDISSSRISDKYFMPQTATKNRVGDENDDDASSSFNSRLLDKD